MLLWLQRKAKATHIWLQFAMAVFAMHLIVLLLFFLRFASSRVYQFSLRKTHAHSEAPVIFAPFGEQKVASVKKNEKPIAQKQATKKVVPIQVNKKSIAKKEKPKVEAAVKQEQKKTEEKVEKKTALNSVALEQKKEIKPTVVKDEQPEAQKETKAKEKIPALPDSKEKLQASEQRIITSAHELEQLAMYEFLSCTIGPRWKPPCCGDSKTECQVKFSVGQDGKIVTIEIAKSSGILLFDIAARNACEITQNFPAWARLKEFCITMKV